MGRRDLGSVVRSLRCPEPLSRASLFPWPPGFEKDGARIRHICFCTKVRDFQTAKVREAVPSSGQIVGTSRNVRPVPLGRTHFIECGHEL